MRDDHRRFPDIAGVAMALTPSYPVYCLRPEVLKRTAERFIELFPGTGTTSRPVQHRLSIVRPGMVSGQPALSSAIRAIFTYSPF